MRFELRLFFAAFLLLALIVATCRCETVARMIDASGPAALVSPARGAIVETI